MDVGAQGPIQGPFRVVETGENKGKLIYTNAQGIDKAYTIKVAGSVRTELKLLHSMVTMLNAHVPEVKLAEGQSLRVKDKGIKTVGAKQEKTYVFKKEGSTPASRAFEANFGEFVHLANTKTSPQPPSVLVSQSSSTKEILRKDLARLRLSHPKKNDEVVTENKENRELEFYRICGSQISYESWNKGDAIGHAGYKVDEVITNKLGLQIVVLVSEIAGNPPVFCCRGTENVQNIIDDLGKNIGEYGFEPSRDQIEDTLIRLLKDHGPAVITGHSLGGALAQIIAATFTQATSKKYQSSIIKEVYHFNAPGVGERYASMYDKSKLICLSRGCAPPIVHSARHNRDIVYHAGGKHIEANDHIKYYNLKRTPPSKAHSISHVYERMNTRRSEGVRKTHKVFRFVAEGLRVGIIGKAIRAALLLKNPISPNDEEHPTPVLRG